MEIAIAWMGLDWSGLYWVNWKKPTDYGISVVAILSSWRRGVVSPSADLGENKEVRSTSQAGAHSSLAWPGANVSPQSPEGFGGSSTDEGEWLSTGICSRSPSRCTGCSSDGDYFHLSPQFIL